MIGLTGSGVAFHLCLTPLRDQLTSNLLPLNVPIKTPHVIAADGTQLHMSDSEDEWASDHAARDTAVLDAVAPEWEPSCFEEEPEPQSPPSNVLGLLEDTGAGPKFTRR